MTNSSGTIPLRPTGMHHYPENTRNVNITVSHVLTQVSKTETSYIFATAAAAAAAEED